jgi:hypothetical protein
MVKANVEFVGGLALVTIANRRAEPIDVRVRGIEPSAQAIMVQGATTASLPFDVLPGAEVTIHLHGAPEPILFQGTSPGGEATDPSRSSDDQHEESPQSFPGGEPGGWPHQGFHAFTSGGGFDPGAGAGTYAGSDTGSDTGDGG